MAQDNQPEKETESREQGTEQQTTETRSDFEVREQKTVNSKQETERPIVPDATRPEIPAEEAKPQGGPGDQPQNTTTAPADDQNQTDKAEVKRVEEQLRKKIPTGTKEERRKSAEVEDSHNANVLNQAE